MCSKFGYADYIHDAGITCTVEDFIRRLERERIIKLLFEEGKHGINFFNKEPYFDSNFDRLVGCGCCAELGRGDIIALIKGENE